MTDEITITYPTDSAREAYEKDLIRRRREHMDAIKRQNERDWRPCMHDSCPECVGTGIKRDGRVCVHAISCPCPKCSMRF